MQKGDVTMVTRKRNHRMTCRLNDDEYERVLIKISKSGLSKQEYILSSLLNKKINEKFYENKSEEQPFFPPE